MIDIDAIFPLRSERMTAALEAAPRCLVTASLRVDYRDPLALDDPRYVRTTSARGELFERHFHLALGYDAARNTMSDPGTRGRHLLVFGHVGCGKSTELAHLATALHQRERYWVVHVDLHALIDTNNARYSDVWLAVAHELVRQLQQDGIAIEDGDLNDLHDWFKERVLVHDRMREVTLGVDAGAKVGVRIPLLAEILTRLTTSVRFGGSHRDTIREVVSNTYAQFAEALNRLIDSATRRVRALDRGRHLLFVVDGADRCREEDWKRLFVGDANQLTQISCNAIYAAPMALKVSGHRYDLFDHVVLPMVKLVEADGLTRRAEAFDALRELVLKRCHHSLFAGIEDLDELIAWSGGHLRDLLRLLSFACVDAHEVIDARAIALGVSRLGAEYRDRITQDQFRVLVEIDQRRINLGTSEMLADMVAKGALLEYNAGSWRQSHPVVRTLAGYQHAAEQLRLQRTVAELA